MKKLDSRFRGNDTGNLVDSGQAKTALGQRTMRRWIRHGIAAGLAALAFAPSASRAASVEDFYKGRQITMILSADAGGGYGSYANAFAPYLSAHIPGKPKIIVQYMPGAGGLRAMNYLYSAAPKDGTTIALVHSSVPFAPVYGMAAAKFDPRKIGSAPSTRRRASASPGRRPISALGKICSISSSSSAAPERVPRWKPSR